LQEFEATLGKAATIEQCLDTIYACSSDFSFSGVRMYFHESVFEHFGTPPSGALWQLRIPLNPSQYINFFRDFASEMDPVILNAFVSAVERGLRVCPALTLPAAQPPNYSLAEAEPVELSNLQAIAS